jgi:hypothetical protein
MVVSYAIPTVVHKTSECVRLDALQYFRNSVYKFVVYVTFLVDLLAAK